MKVVIDSTPLETGHKFRGMGVYTRNLINAIKESGKVKVVERDPDIVHVPYFDLFFPTLSIPSSVPTVVTVPDVIPLLYPRNYPPGVKGRINMWRQIRELGGASAVITISETSKKDIVRFLGVPEYKIFVTYLAPGNILEKKRKIGSEIKLGLPKKYVLYVGDVNYNKNIISLVKACKRIGISVVIVGKQALSDDYDRHHIENASLVELQSKYGDDRQVIRLGYLENDELEKVWSGASVYCQPSLYEGFGLPVLEAQAHGVPVVASRTQALVEIAEGSALFFDPHNISDIESKLRKALGSREVRNELRAKGKRNVGKFSWSKTAKATIDVYKNVLKNA